MEQWRRSLVLVIGCTAAMVVPVLGQGRGPSRDELLDAFRDLRGQAKAAYQDAFSTAVIVKSKGESIKMRVVTDKARASLKKFKGVEVAGTGTTATGGKIKQMVKVWARPVVNGQESDRKVNLERYKWRPAQRLNVYFETAVPVYVSFYQDFEGKPSQKVFPDSKFPYSSKMIEPGKAVKFQPMIELDEGTEDELMRIVVETAGTDDVPVLPDGGEVNLKVPEGKYLVFGRDVISRLGQKASTARPLLKFRPADEDAQPDSTDGDPDEVATIAFGSDHSGSLQLRLRKKKM